MRAVVQRVSNSSVEAEGKKIAAIEHGLLVLVGFHKEDSIEDLEYIANKILSLRIFNDGNNIMNLSLDDTSGDLLIISQFTLYGDARKGRRPSYSEAMPPDNARKFFDDFVGMCRNKHNKTKSGIFGAEMKIYLINSGPVTILLDSRKIF